MHHWQPVWSRGTNNFRSATATGFDLALKMCEHNLMGEDQRPFKGVGTVGVLAADKLVLAVRLANQFGVAELADNLAAAAFGDDIFQFYTPPPYATGLGQRLSNRKFSLRRLRRDDA
jgi:hypothetical protein